MELAPATEPWTVTVAWARPWRRPFGLPRASRAALLPGETITADAHLEEALAGAVADLELARAALGDVPPSDDPWPELMARHAVYLTRRNLRALGELFDIPVGPGLRHP